MATSPDHPSLQFVQASGYTKGRPDGPPLWIVIHDMEAHETPTTAENTANYFAAGADGRQVSSHYCVDNNSVVQCVRIGDVAWTVGNRPGNNRGINWELSGFASQSREQWLDPFGAAMFGQMAPIVRADAAKYGIPLRKLSVAELKSFTPGVTSHYELGIAFGGTDHTDPGPNFPWDYFISAMQGKGGTAMKTIVRKSSDKSLWLCDTMHARRITEGEAADLRYIAKQGAVQLWNGGQVWEGLVPAWGLPIDGSGSMVAVDYDRIEGIVRDVEADALEGGAAAVREG